MNLSTFPVDPFSRVLAFLDKKSFNNLSKATAKERQVQKIFSRDDIWRGLHATDPKGILAEVRVVSSSGDYYRDLEKEILQSSLGL